MLTSTRNKRKLRESPSLVGGATDQQLQDKSQTMQAARRTGTPGLQLSVPQLEEYYPGTSIPTGGWFHACR